MISPLSRPALILLLLAPIWALAAGCDSEERAPTLLAIDPQEVAVNASLVIELRVENPDGVSLDFSVEDPGLPSFSEVTDLAATPSGGEFRWTPLASHVGTYELVFTIDSSAGSSSQSTVVTVIPSASAAPTFLRPGFGGTYDLQVDPCVVFDIEVRDDDSLEVGILAREPLPEGAVIEPAAETSKRATFNWCPQEEQYERTLRWPIALEADDGDHEPTPHDYQVVLRTPTKDNCPGAAPVVAIDAPADGASVATPGGYAVDITVTDDVGVRDEPILYYTTTQPEEPLDINAFEQRLFQKTGAETWRATIPPLDLADGESQTIWIFAEATDNDDESGTSCDHRTETPVRKFTASGSGGVTADACAPCTASSQCTSGVCAADGGGTCLPSCAAGAACAEGACGQRSTIEGQSVDACGDAEAVCNGTVTMCVADGNEPNDAVGSATPYDLAGGAPVTATICAGDVDHWGLSTAMDTDITVILDGFESTADLDLELLGPAGMLLAASGTTNAVEQISYCLEGGSSAVASVYAYLGEGESEYTLTVASAPGSCCADDTGEPDSTLADARAAAGDGSFDGTICPGDDDYVSFEVAGPMQLEVLLVFDSAEVELDLELYGPNGSFIVGAWSNTADEETLSADLSEAGTYAVRVVPFGDGAGDYLGTVTLSGLAGCTSTLQCPTFNVCDDAGECVLDGPCSSDGECPSNHTCAGDALFGICSMICAVNADCRSTEACKWFQHGARGCGARGAGQNGESCTSYEGCGGQRDCITSLPGGYCARAACTSDSNCESDTFCADIGGGLNICVKRCGGVEPPCRMAEGYSCQSIMSVGGTSEQGCAL